MKVGLSLGEDRLPSAAREVWLDAYLEHVVTGTSRHLAWLRDRIGDGFLRGIVFHTGPYPFELDERIWALPIYALWAATA